MRNRKVLSSFSNLSSLDARPIQNSIDRSINFKLGGGSSIIFLFYSLSPRYRVEELSRVTVLALEENAISPLAYL